MYRCHLVEVKLAFIVIMEASGDSCLVAEGYAIKSSSCYREVIPA